MFTTYRRAAVAAAATAAAALIAVPAAHATSAQQFPGFPGSPKPGSCATKTWSAANYQESHCISLLQDYVKHGWGLLFDEPDGRWSANTSHAIASWQARYPQLESERGFVGVKTNRVLCARGITDLEQLIKNGTPPTGLSELGLDAVKEYCTQPAE